MHFVQIPLRLKSGSFHPRGVVGIASVSEDIKDIKTLQEKKTKLGLRVLPPI